MEMPRPDAMSLLVWPTGASLQETGMAQPPAGRHSQRTGPTRIAAMEPDESAMISISDMLVSRTRRS